MSATGTLDQERLGSEDIEFLKTLRRTFESMSMGNRSRVEASADGTNTRRNNGPRSNSAWRANYEAYKVKSDELVQEIYDLRQLFERTGGDQTVRIVEVLKGSPWHINNLDKALSDAENFGSDSSVAEVMSWLQSVWIECAKIEDTLYSQKHAFNFIYLRRLKEACKTTVDTIGSLSGAEAKLSLIFNDLVPKLAKQYFPDVIKELRTFSTNTLPSYVTAEEERATTQYLALTTIATFFSSITATTLQFSYQQTSSGLSSAVNLFWIISLVFSVSSGINSLLSMIWRKSIVFSKFKPPKYINFWLTKSPVVFLAIAAFAFIVGLNLFPYSSEQHIYVSSVTNVLTVLHVLGLLLVTSWYLVKLEWSTYFIQSVRRHLLWVLHHDDKVILVNDVIGLMTGWPTDAKIHPHPFAKLIRYCVSVFSYFKRTSKEIIAPISFWVKQHVLHSLSKFARGVFKLTMTSVRRAKHTFRTLFRRWKHLHFNNSNTMLRDLEVGNNHTSGGSDNAVFLEGMSEVDRTVDKYISSLDKTFSVQYHQPAVRFDTSRWRNGIRTTDLIVRFERNMLWGYPTIYRQFEEEILPAMRAVDELRSRPSHIQQQSQDVSRLGLSDPNNSPPFPIPQTVDAGGQDVKNGLQTPLRSGYPTQDYGPIPSPNSSYPLQHEYWLHLPYLPQHARPSAPVWNSPNTLLAPQAPPFPRASLPTHAVPPLPQHPHSYIVAGRPSPEEAAATHGQKQGGPLWDLPYIARDLSGSAIDAFPMNGPYNPVHHPDQAMHASGSYMRRPDFDAYGNLTSDTEQVAECGRNADPAYSDGIAESMGLQVPPISSGAAGANGGHDYVDLPSSPRADEDQGSDNEDGESQRRRDLRLRVQDGMTQGAEGSLEPTTTE